MSLEFLCPECQRIIITSFLKTGEQAKCYSCGETTIVPNDAIETDKKSPVYKRVPRKNISTTLHDGELFTEVQKYLSAWKTPSRQSSANLIWLIISMILFFSIGSAVFPIETIGAILVVIFVHELGHVVAMKTLGYKNISMLFVPLLGAFVRGRPVQPTAAKKGAVSLAGPGPGILFGIAILFFANSDTNALLIRIAQISLFINLFNLLPLYPLDGGRILEVVLFANLPRSRVVFQALAAIGLVVIGLTNDYIVLLIISLLTIRHLRLHWLEAQTILKIYEVLPNRNRAIGPQIPENYLRKVLPYLANQTSNEDDRAWYVASIVHWAWKQVRQRQSGLLAAGVIIFTHGLLLAGGIWAYLYWLPDFNLAR